MRHVPASPCGLTIGPCDHQKTLRYSIDGRRAFPAGGHRARDYRGVRPRRHAPGPPCYDRRCHPGCGNRRRPARGTGSRKVRTLERAEGSYPLDSSGGSVALRSRPLIGLHFRQRHWCLPHCPVHHHAGPHCRLPGHSVHRRAPATPGRCGHGCRGGCAAAGQRRLPYAGMANGPDVPPGLLDGTGGRGRTGRRDCPGQESRRPLRFTFDNQRAQHAGRPAGHRSSRRHCRRALSGPSVLRCQVNESYSAFRTHQHCGVGRPVPSGAAVAT